MTLITLVSPDEKKGICGVAQAGDVLYAISPCCYRELTSSTRSVLDGYNCSLCQAEFPAFHHMKDGRSRGIFLPSCNLGSVNASIPELWVRAVLQNPDAKVSVEK